MECAALRERTVARARSARVGRWRVLFQALLYLALAAHMAAWYRLGWRDVGTLSAASLFYLLQVGLINAGVFLVAAALLSTLVLGNVFCGWACHFGALQDFALWVFRKVGLRPLGWEAPVRLRAVLLVKVLVVNTALTWLTLGALPRLFVNCAAPEPLFAVGTGITVALDVLVLAFVPTYVFGPRAFCRLLCPVILIARIGNRTAPARMVRMGPCSGCGACDRVCPMRNPVSAQIRDEGAVSAPDCVRCGRCLDACRDGAIGFAFRKPGARREIAAPKVARSGALAVAAGGVLGIVAYEALARAQAAGLLRAEFLRHLPNWEFFYAALGVLLGAAVFRFFRKGDQSCRTS